MTTVLYIDLYFIFNFSVDVLCLYLCGMLCSKRTAPLPLSLSASFGALYACAALYISNSLISLILSFVVSLLMFFLAFKEKSFLTNLFGGTALFSVSALFGGMYVFIISLFSSVQKKDNFTLLAYIICGFISIALVRFISNKSISTPLVAEIHFMDKETRVDAIVDTANFLSEPISARGVAVLSLSACSRLLESDVIIFIDGINSGEISDELKRRMRYIKMSTANGESLAPCLRADKFVIINGKRRTECELYFTASEAIEGTSAECLLPNKINLKI